MRDGLDIASTAALIACLIQGLVNTWVLSGYRLNLKDQFGLIWQDISPGILRLVACKTGV